MARRWLDSYIEDSTDAANDLSEDVRRLKLAIELDTSHPQIFRAFVRGACGFDIALDCSMIFFLAMCIGDESTYTELHDKHSALEFCYGNKDPQFATAQSRWLEVQETFMNRVDVLALLTDI